MNKKSIFKDGANKNLTHPTATAGITLIALVITILVVLILTGVSIATLSGDNGILKKAVQAKEDTKKALEKEMLDLEEIEKEIDNQTTAKVKNITTNIEYPSIKKAIDNAEDNDIIEIGGGEHNLVEDDSVTEGAIIAIDKSITIKAANPKNKPTLLVESSDGTTDKSIINSIEIKADNVCIENIILKIGEGKTGTGNLLKISARDNTSTAYYKNIIIDGCEFYGADHSIEMYVNNAIIQNCIFDESKAVDQGNIMVIKATTGDLNIINNSFIGNLQKKHGISFYAGTNSYIQGNILIENNTFEQVYKPIVHESSMTYENVSVAVKDNTFKNYKKKAVSIDKGSYIEYIVTGNIFDIPSEGTVIIDNGVEVIVDTNNNYWGTSEPDKTGIFEGNVNATTYYAHVDKRDKVNW